MKKVVIAGSVKLQKEVKEWICYWEKQGYEVIDSPKTLEEDDFLNQYPEIYRKFLQNITIADLFFVANENKNRIEGYIGAETFAELAFAVSQNIIYAKKIEILLAKMPSDKVQSAEEVNLWIKLGWIKVLNS